MLQIVFLIPEPRPNRTHMVSVVKELGWGRDLSSPAASTFPLLPRKPPLLCRCHGNDPTSLLLTFTMETANLEAPSLSGRRWSLQPPSPTVLEIPTERAEECSLVLGATQKCIVKGRMSPGMQVGIIFRIHPQVSYCIHQGKSPHACVS